MVLARNDPHKNELLPTLQDMALVEEQTGHYQDALKTHAELSLRKDSLFNNERSRIIAAANAKYDLEKKESHISLQNKQIRLQRVTAEAARIKLLASNQKMYFLLAGIVLLSLFTLIVGYSYYRARQLQKQLAESNRLKDQMFSIISHDLRNPVGSLKASLTLLQSKKQSRENLDHFVQQVDFLQYTMDNVLYWSLSQQDAIRAIPRWVDPGEIIEEVTESLRGLIRIKEIELAVKGYAEEIQIDEQLLVIVLRNILHNAIKFTPPGGSIILETVSDPTGTQIRVQDTGPGLEPEKVSGSAARKQGTGLGLNLSRELMKRNGGELKISSQPHAGTTVTLYWNIENDRSLNNMKRTVQPSV
jgi:signal transduction histidine kinase